MTESDPISRLSKQLAGDDQSVGPIIRSAIETLHRDASDPVPAEVLARARGLAVDLPRPPTWLETFDRLAARVLAPLFDDGPALAMGLRGDDLRQCTMAIDDFRLDLEIEVDVARHDEEGRTLTVVRGQLDVDLSVDGEIRIAVLDAVTRACVTHASLGSDGRFDLVLPEGRYDFVFAFPDGGSIVGTVEVP
ncbi:MAG: hypothetical protein RLZZ461_949 [Planctomycetota bacterium]|jgi:hypothetical protein